MMRADRSVAVGRRLGAVSRKESQLVDCAVERTRRALLSPLVPFSQSTGPVKVSSVWPAEG